MSTPFAIASDSWPETSPDTNEPAPPIIEWGTMGAITARVSRDGFAFAAILQPVYGGWGWVAIGVVTPLPTDDLGTKEMLDAVLGSHAHQNLGRFDDLEEARQVVIGFLRHSPVPELPCPCAPFESTVPGVADPEAVTERSP